MRMKRKAYFTFTAHSRNSIHLNESPTMGLHIPITLVVIAVILSSPEIFGHVSSSLPRCAPASVELHVVPIRVGHSSGEITVPAHSLALGTHAESQRPLPAFLGGVPQRDHLSHKLIVNESLPSTLACDTRTQALK